MRFLDALSSILRFDRAKPPSTDPVNKLPLWREGQNDTPIKVRRNSKWLQATFRTESGKQYDALQRTDSETGSAVCKDARPIEIILFSGQSNAGDSPNPAQDRRNGSPFLGRSWFPNHVFKTDKWHGSYAEKMPRESEYDDFLPATDNAKYGVWPQTAFLYALEALNRVHGQLGPGYCARTDWFGEQPLETFLDGQPQFENSLLSGRVLTRIAAKYGRPTKLGAFIFIHGENRGTHNRETYGLTVQKHFERMRSALASQTNLAPPPVLYCQINQGSRWPKPSGIELAQLDIHRAGGAAHFLTGPMYQYPLVVQGKPGDLSAIHQNILGKMMLGETLALAYRQVHMRGSFDPLRPVAAQLEGTLLKVEFSVPPGSRLAFDIDWIKGKPSGKSGFVVAAGSRNIAIESIGIHGDSAIIVRLADAPPEGPLTVRYALDPEPVDFTNAKLGDSRFAPSTGRLFAETGIPSPFAERGFFVPKTIRHYCVRFEMTVQR
jgi:hypothetical protein